MKLAALISGGKDSIYALFKAMKEHDVVCLITVFSKNPESYMFHTPNIWITELQAEAIGLPLVKKTTEGKKETELEDLKHAISEAKKKYGIESIVTGAIRSNYQASRIEKICKDLDLQCINPLWHIDEIELLNEVKDLRIITIITGIFAFPLEKEMLGKPVNEEFIKKMIDLREKYQINPAGEGGEIETTVLDAPFFKKKIELIDTSIEYKNYSGIFKINKARLVKK